MKRISLVLESISELEFLSLFYKLMYLFLIILILIVLVQMFLALKSLNQKLVKVEEEALGIEIKTKTMIHEFQGDLSKTRAHYDNLDFKSPIARMSYEMILENWSLIVFSSAIIKRYTKKKRRRKA